MKKYDPNIASYSKLYYGIGSFKDFQQINENDLYQIMEDVDYFKNFDKSVGFENYKNTMNYLTGSRLSIKYDFDIKMAFLILCCDPDLAHFYTYIKSSIVCESVIKELESTADICDAKNARIKQLKILKEKIKYKTDFYDLNLIDIEFSFFKRFYSDKLLLINVNANMIDSICNNLLDFSFFNKLTDIEILKLVQKSNKYLQYFADINKNICINNLAFNILYQAEMLGLENNIQKLFFFILTIDRECKALNYYNMPYFYDQKYEIESIVGFYDERLFEAERKYQKRLYE